MIRTLGLAFLILICFTFCHAGKEIWISDSEITRLPSSGTYWNALLSEANQSTASPNLSDQNDRTNVTVLAKALVYVKTGQVQYRNEVIQACMDAMETENGGRTLALGRELGAYVLAADLVGLPSTEDTQFRNWLSDVRTETLDGRTLISTHRDRPNNWGTMAGGSRIAAAIYLNDTTDLSECAMVFKGFCGDRTSWNKFSFKALYWQYDSLNPVPINPKGATKNGPDEHNNWAIRNIDGVLPDDQRRWQDSNDPMSGEFIWCDSALKEEYPWESLQGVIVQAVLLHRQGYDAFNWEDQAVLRAYKWINEVANNPADGDDIWQMPLVDYYYGTSYWDSTRGSPGKNMGWTWWTHVGRSPVQNRIEKIEYSANLNRPVLWCNGNLVKFIMPAEGNVSLALFNVRGRQVSPVINRIFKKGLNSIKLSRRNYPSGVYILNLYTNCSESHTRVYISK
jgi:hypothetical protein